MEPPGPRPSRTTRTTTKRPAGAPRNTGDHHEDTTSHQGDCPETTTTAPARSIQDHSQNAFHNDLGISGVRRRLAGFTKTPKILSPKSRCDSRFSSSSESDLPGTGASRRYSINHHHIQQIGDRLSPCNSLGIKGS